MQNFQNSPDPDIAYKNRVLQGIIAVRKNDYQKARTLLSEAARYDNPAFVRSIRAVDGTDILLSGFLCPLFLFIKGETAEISAGTQCMATVPTDVEVNVD